MTIYRECKLLDGTTRGALYSDCEKYRYRLDVIWEPKVKPINFICLNPSTATEQQDDPTVHRLIQRSKRLNGGGLIVTNLFAYRATNPNELLHVDDPHGPLCAPIAHDAARLASMVICGWGQNDRQWGRGKMMKSCLEKNGIKLFVLKLTKDGFPMHPLYLPYSLEPTPWQ